MAEKGNGTLRSCTCTMIKYFGSNRLVVLQSKVPVSAINRIHLHTVKKVTKTETMCYLSQWVSSRVTQGNNNKKKKIRNTTIKGTEIVFVIIIAILK